MQTLKVPKRIPIDLMRSILGDSRTEDFLTAAYGPKLLGPANIHVRREAFENMLAHLQGRTVQGMKPTAYQQAIPAIFRLYFRESPKAKSRVVLWLKTKLETTGDGEAASTAPGTLIAKGAARMAKDTVKVARKRGGRKARAKVTA